MMEKAFFNVLFHFLEPHMEVRNEILAAPGLAINQNLAGCWNATMTVPIRIPFSSHRSPGINP